jgi:signal transduction histidine kinase
MVLDLSERLEAERLLEERRREIEFLVERLLALQEDERSRLSRELHDHIGQTLTALKLNVAALGSGVVPPRQALVDDTLGILDDALEAVRTLSFDLRPAMLDELGLSNAVRAYAIRQAETAGLDLRLVVADARRAAASEMETACFRILQEAVTNAIRHAEAVSLSVELTEEDDALVLRVGDDGRGFDPAANGARLGLLIIRERAERVGASVEVASSPGLGTTVTARFPGRGESTS